MNDVPDFETAVASFRWFLAKEGHSSPIVWVFRDDIWKRSPDDVVIKLPRQKENLALAEKVFAEGRDRGLVELHAIASVSDKVAATVWFPEVARDEVQGWERGLKLSIARPLPPAKSAGALRWLYFRRQPKFRLYQEYEVHIGTKSWAAAH